MLLVYLACEHAILADAEHFEHFGRSLGLYPQLQVVAVAAAARGTNAVVLAVGSRNEERGLSWLCRLVQINGVATTTVLSGARRVKHSLPKPLQPSFHAAVAASCSTAGLTAPQFLEMVANSNDTGASSTTIERRCTLYTNKQSLPSKRLYDGEC